MVLRAMKRCGLWMIGLLLAFVNVGCGRDNVAGSDRLYLGPLSRDDLLGYWVATPESVVTLAKLGYTTHTNRTDNILVLAQDGGCIFRRVGTYRPMRIIGKYYPENEASLEGYENVPVHMRSWYIWEPGCIDPIRGPHQDTNLVTIGTGRVFYNQWSRWRLDDSSTSGGRFADAFGVGYRYKLSFGRAEYIPRDIFMLVGKDKELFVWKDVTENLDGVPLSSALMIKFKKLSQQDLAVLIKKETAMPEGIRVESRQATNAVMR